MESASSKLATLQPTDLRILSPETEASLQRLLPKFRKELGESQAISGQQTEATQLAVEEKGKLRLYVTHFVNSLNMAIERGASGFRAGDRTYYGMDATQETLPQMDREASLLRVARAVVSGEAKRIAAGGKPVLMPSGEEVEAQLKAVNLRLAEQKKLVAAADQESQDVRELREEVSALVRDIWDEVEFRYRKVPAPTMRRRCREWGVVYTNAPGEVEEEAVRAADASATAPVASGGTSTPTRQPAASANGDATAAVVVDKPLPA